MAPPTGTLWPWECLSLPLSHFHHRVGGLTWGLTGCGGCWPLGTCCAGQGGGASCRRGLADGLAVSGCVTRSCPWAGVFTFWKKGPHLAFWFLSSAGLLLLLLSGLQADSQGKEVRAMVGSDVELSCIYTKEKSLDLNELYVYWQITNASGKVEPVTYYLLGNSSTGHHNNRYKDRAQMSLDSMKQGNFSLRLYNITPQDEQKYDCLVFRKTTERILNVTVTLHVAANYSMPVVIAPTAAPQDEELTFTCTSKDGYPRPNVYWINKTDNSLLDEALQNSTVSLNAQGLYDVVSVLRIRRTPDVNVGCCIENVLLHQNLTVSSQKGSEPIPGTTGSNTDIPGDAEEGRSRTVVAVIALLLTVIVAAAAGWWCRSRCPRRRGYYTGAQAARPERGFTDLHV
ncbi:PREDICTED: ICOS ligand [Myotis brandtii]|uniref:ICOS ligand n=1 Tax=Myotis brandtii TaxID=109478 RepID=UPI000704517A|nr:PREDICTED: ICOS ligand [Myotis brandtii]